MNPAAPPRPAHRTGCPRTAPAAAGRARRPRSGPRPVLVRAGGAPNRAARGSTPPGGRSPNLPMGAGGSRPGIHAHSRSASGSTPILGFVPTGSGHASPPTTRTLPSSGRSRPESIEIPVLLSAPPGPASPAKPTAGGSRPIPEAAARPPNHFRDLITRTARGLPCPAPARAARAVVRPHSPRASLPPVSSCALLMAPTPLPVPRAVHPRTATIRKVMDSHDVLRTACG